MKLDGTYSFQAPQEVVWQALLDPEILARIMPGCERLERIGENEYKGTLKIRVGPVQGQFEGIVTISEQNPPQSYHMQVSGQGAPGFVKGEGQVNLETQNSTTVMHYSGTAQVGGRLAAVGQRLLESSARALTQQSLEALGAQIKALQQPTAAVETAPAAEAPSQTQFAVGVARHMLDELVPAERRPLLLGGLLVGLAGLMAFWVFEEWRINRLSQRVAERLAERYLGRG